MFYHFFLTIMRRKGLFIPIVTFLTMACSREIIETPDNAGDFQKGEITIALTSVDTHQNVTAVKSTVEAPEAEAFNVEIFNASGVRLYRDTYGNAAGTKIPLNAGEYRLLASYGDPAGVGFDAIYFAADQDFTVHGQTSETVSATAKMSNVKVQVNFGENLCQAYPEHYARVKRTGMDDYLQFDADETRAGYIPAGELVMEIYANVDGTWKYYRTESAEYSPNDFVTFNVDTDPREGSVSVSVKIDDSVDVIEKDIKVSSEFAASEAPAVTLSGFEGNQFNFTEAVDYQGCQADFSVPAGIAECVLTVESESGLPAEVDLLNADESVRSQFAVYGIRWNSGMEGSHFGSLDFSGIGKISYDPDNVFSASFTLRIKDNNGKETTTDKFTVTQVPAVVTLNATEGNAFARRIEGVTANVSVGDPEKFALQYSTDNSSWTSVPVTSIEGQNINFGTVSGLEPVTAYHFRTIYNGNEKTVGNEITLTTEEALQIGNSGFEEWTENTYKFNVAAFWDNKSLTWYQPWEADKWWDVNSRKAFNSYSALAGNQNYRSFATVGWSSDAVDGKSAHIFTINTSASSTDNIVYDEDTKVGELFIGTADDGGNHSSDGHSFASRPSALVFMYKYIPVSGETFNVKIEIKSAGGNVLATKNIDDGPASDSWTSYRIDLEYPDLSEKASSIYISFKSSSAADSSAAYEKGTTVEIAGGSYTVHAGSSLRIDNLQMIYE